MPLRFTVTINLDLLADIHIQAAATLAELPLNVDIEEFEHEIEIDGVVTEKQLNTLKNSLFVKLEEHNLTEHHDHIIYLYSLFRNFDAPEFLYEEMLYKYASENVRQLTNLVKLKTETKEKDLIISLKSSKTSTSVTFNTESIISQVWDNLYNSLIHSSTIGSGNHILWKHLEGKELTINNLKSVAKALRVRHNRFWNQSVAHFGKTLLYYFNKYEISKGTTELSSEQARIIFDIMEVFNMVSSPNVSSERDDYIKALFRNNNL